MKENALLQKKMGTKRLTCHQQSSDLPGCSPLQNYGNRSWGSCTETQRRSPVPTPDIVLINIHENRNVSNLLIVFHVEYLYEVGLPAVVLGEGDGAGEPLYPGGVGGDWVGEVELHHRQGQALVLPVSSPTSCLTQTSLEEGRTHLMISQTFMFSSGERRPLEAFCSILCNMVTVVRS